MLKRVTLYLYVFIKKILPENADCHARMLNLTARIAVKMSNLPGWEVDWSDSQPQCPRLSLTCSDFLPSAEDAEAFRIHAEHFLMEFLVKHFTSLKDLEEFIPARQSPHPVAKTIAVPMKILFKDEKYKSETIEILSQLAKDAELPGNPQVFGTSDCVHKFR